MQIIKLLREEESKLQKQLTAIQGAIAALNGHGGKIASRARAANANTSSGKRTLSAAGRAAISRAAKARWARIRAQKTRKESR